MAINTLPVPRIRHTLAEDMPWVASSACRGMDVNLFYGPEGTERSERTRVRQAKEVCTFCAVRSECLRWAVEHHESGIWGGLTHRERRALRAAQLRGTRKARL